MAFHNSLLTVAPDIGYSSGWSWDTVVQTTASGHETRIQRRSQGRRRCVLTFSLRDNPTATTIETFLAARRGAAHSFPWKDVLDYTSNPTDRASTTTANTDQPTFPKTGDGTNTLFQITKVYDDGVTNPWTRNITLPITGTVTVALNGVNQASGWSVNLTTGVITFSSPPGNGVVVTAGFQHYIAVRSDQSADQFAERKMASFNVNQMSLTLWEVLDEVEFADTIGAGGYRQLTPTADFSIDPSEAVIYDVTVAASALNAYLPPTGPIPGGEVFKSIKVIGSSGTLQLKDHEGSNIGSALAVGADKRVLLFNDGTNAQWRVA